MKDKIVTIETTCKLAVPGDLVISQGIKYRAIKSLEDYGDGKEFYYTLIGAGDVNGVVLHNVHVKEILPLQVEVDNPKRKRKIKIRKVQALAK